jgi:hypothetical protein
MLGVFAPDLAPSSIRAKPEQLFTANALSRCKVAIIPTARAANALQSLPAGQLVRVLERGREQWTHLCCRLLGFLTMNVRDRLRQAIAEIAETFGVADARGRLITLRLSHEDLAALVGASRPMVSKHLKELASDGVLTKQQGRYVLVTPPEAGADEGGEMVGIGARTRQLGANGKERDPGRTVRPLGRSSGGGVRSRENDRMEAKGPVRSV